MTADFSLNKHTQKLLLSCHLIENMIIHYTTNDRAQLTIGCSSDKFQSMANKSRCSRIWKYAQKFVIT